MLCLINQTYITVTFFTISFAISRQSVIFLRFGKGSVNHSSNETHVTSERLPAGHVRVKIKGRRQTEDKERVNIMTDGFPGCVPASIGTPIKLSEYLLFFPPHCLAVFLGFHSICIFFPVCVERSLGSNSYKFLVAFLLLYGKIYNALPCHHF